jgi:hypothetical protein
VVHPPRPTARTSLPKDISAVHLNHLSWRRIDGHVNYVTGMIAHLELNQKSDAGGSDAASVRNVTGKKRRPEVEVREADDHKVWTLSTNWMLRACMDKDVSQLATRCFGRSISNKRLRQCSTTTVHSMPATPTVTPKKIAEHRCRHSLPIPPTCGSAGLGLSAVA